MPRFAIVLLAGLAAGLVGYGFRPLPSWPEVDTHANVLLVGDSITAWWPRPQVDALGRADTVQNLGVPSYRVAHALAQVTDLRGSEARVVVVALGTNDLGDRHTPRRIVRDLATLVDDVHAAVPLAHVVVVVPPPRAGGVTGAREEVERGLRALADDGVPGVSVVEVPWAWGRHTYDGVHPTPAGYSIYADALGPVVRRYAGSP